MPPAVFGLDKVCRVMRGFLPDQMKARTIIMFTWLKNLLGIAIGILWKKYNTWGEIVIFTTAALPNHEKGLSPNL